MRYDHNNEHPIHISYQPQRPRRRFEPTTDPGGTVPVFINARCGTLPFCIPGTVRITIIVRPFGSIFQIATTITAISIMPVQYSSG
jgi:hypothetical protein